MTLRPVRTAAILAALLLAACSGNAPPRPAADTSPAFAAMARGTVEVEGGLITVAFPGEGVIARVAVKPGDRVRRGAALAELDRRAADLAVALAGAELDRATAAGQALRDRLPALQARAERLRAGANAGVAEGQQAAEAEDALRQARADLPAADAETEAARQRLAQARFEAAQRTLASPVDGEIVSIAAQPGNVVSPQDHAAAVQILPDAPMLIRAEVNEGYIGRIRTGQRAEVESEAGGAPFPLPAHVIRIGRVVEAGHLGDEPAAGRVIRCDLALDSLSPSVRQNLRVGQTVLVKFHD